MLNENNVIKIIGDNMNLILIAPPAAGKGTMPKKTASRHISRLAQAVKNLFK